MLLILSCSSGGGEDADRGPVDLSARDMGQDTTVRDQVLDRPNVDGHRLDRDLDLDRSFPDGPQDLARDQAIGDLPDASDLVVDSSHLADLPADVQPGDCSLWDATPDQALANDLDPPDQATPVDQLQTDLPASPDLGPPDQATPGDQFLPDLPSHSDLAPLPDVAVADSIMPPDTLTPDTLPPAGCTAKCMAQAPFLCVTNSSSVCLECTTDGHCTGNPFALGNKCLTSVNVCTCSQDSDCSGRIFGHKCDTTLQRCGCASSADCATGMTCGAALFGGKICIKGCMSDADCISGSQQRCNKSTGQCVDCLTSADCSATMPLCAPSTNRCVGCLNNAQCAGSGDGNSCDASRGACGCATDAHCAGAGAYGAKCIAYTFSGTKALLCRCSANTDCKGKTAGPTCSTAEAICTCAKDAECTIPGHPRCAPPFSGAGYKQCLKGCTTDKECAALGGGLPRCVSGTCQACAGDADCSSASAGYCLKVGGENRCVACKTSADCPGSMPVCDTATGTCKACSVDSECAASLDGARCVLGVCACAAASDCGTHTWGGKCLSTGRCGCGDPTHCSGNLNGPTCSPTMSMCACAGNAQCPSSRPICKQASGLPTHWHCTPACTSNKACSASSSARKCNTSTGACVGCVQASDCALYPSFPWYKVCSAGGKCLECIKDADCGAGSLGNKCDIKVNACICAKDADCTSNSNGTQCLSAFGTCGCSTPSHCPTGKTCGGTSAIGFKYCL